MHRYGHRYGHRTGTVRAPYGHRSAGFIHRLSEEAHEVLVCTEGTEESVEHLSSTLAYKGRRRARYVIVFLLLFFANYSFHRQLAASAQSVSSQRQRQRAR